MSGLLRRFDVAQGRRYLRNILFRNYAPAANDGAAPIIQPA
jgi:hypothetical protein